MEQKKLLIFCFTNLDLSFQRPKKRVCFLFLGKIMFFHGGVFSFKGPLILQDSNPSRWSQGSTGHHNFFLKIPGSLFPKKKTFVTKKVDHHFFRKTRNEKEPPNANGFGCFGIFWNLLWDPCSLCQNVILVILSKWLPWPLDPDWKSHSLH